MKIKKEYTFKSSRQIWRIIPADTEKLIIEEINKETKEAFFNCLDLKTGRKIFENLQFEEKFWLGIETVYKDVIFFHKFRKPDMPGHNAIIAFDINSKKILWETGNFSFLFIHEEKVYVFIQKFEGRNFYQLDYLTGEIINDLGNDRELIDNAKEEFQKKNNYNDYFFPEFYDSSKENYPEIVNIFNNEKEENIISGKIEYINYNNLLLFNYHEASSGNFLKNFFKIVDKDTGKVIFKDVLDKETKTFKPDSFFIKKNQLFLLKGNQELTVYSIIPSGGS